MEIMVDGRPWPVPDGAAVTFINTDGRLLGVFKVEGAIFSDLLGQTMAPFDPTKAAHTELEVTTCDVPIASGKPRVQDVTKLRICRDKLGNVVTCPPR